MNENEIRQLREDISDRLERWINSEEDDMPEDKIVMQNNEIPDPVTVTSEPDERPLSPLQSHFMENLFGTSEALKQKASLEKAKQEIALLEVHHECSAKLSAYAERILGLDIDRDQCKQVHVGRKEYWSYFEICGLTIGVSTFHSKFLYLLDSVTSPQGETKWFFTGFESYEDLNSGMTVHRDAIDLWLNAKRAEAIKAERPTVVYLSQINENTLAIEASRLVRDGYKLFDTYPVLVHSNFGEHPYPVHVAVLVLE